MFVNFSRHGIHILMCCRFLKFLNSSFHNLPFVLQVSDEAHKCLNVLLTQYDPSRCLGVCAIQIGNKNIF